MTSQFKECLPATNDLCFAENLDFCEGNADIKTKARCVVECGGAKDGCENGRTFSSGEKLCQTFPDCQHIDSATYLCPLTNKCSKCSKGEADACFDIKVNPHGFNQINTTTESCELEDAFKEGMYFCEANGQWLKSCSGGVYTDPDYGMWVGTDQGPCVDTIFKGDVGHVGNSNKFNTDSYDPYNNSVVRSTKPPYPIDNETEFYKLHYRVNGDDQFCKLAQTWAQVNSTDAKSIPAKFTPEHNCPAGTYLCDWTTDNHGTKLNFMDQNSAYQGKITCVSDCYDCYYQQIVADDETDIYAAYEPTSGYDSPSASEWVNVDKTPNHDGVCKSGAQLNKELREIKAGGSNKTYFCADMGWGSPSRSFTDSCTGCTVASYNYGKPRLKKEREADEGGICEINGRCPNQNEIYCPTLNGGECIDVERNEFGYPHMDACYVCPNATGVYTFEAVVDNDGSIMYGTFSDNMDKYHMCTEANETFCSDKSATPPRGYNYCETDRSCKEESNEGCAHCPKNTFDPPGALDFEEDGKSCLSQEEANSETPCEGKFYCNANGHGKCVDNCDSCIENGPNGEQFVFKQIGFSGDNKMCVNINCGEIKSAGGEPYKYCDTTNACVATCGSFTKGCTNHTHEKDGNCIVPQIRCCNNKNATNWKVIIPGIAEFTYPWNECNVVDNSLCEYLPGPNEADEDFSFDSTKCHANATMYGKFDFGDGSGTDADIPNRLGTNSFGGYILEDEFEIFKTTNSEDDWYYEMASPKFEFKGQVYDTMAELSPMMSACMMADPPASFSDTSCQQFEFIMETTTTKLGGYGKLGKCYSDPTTVGCYPNGAPDLNGTTGTWNGDDMGELIDIYKSHEMSGLAYGKYIDVCSAIKIYKERHSTAFITHEIAGPQPYGMPSNPLGKYLPGEALCDFFTEPRYPFSQDAEGSFNARKECCACGGGTCRNTDNGAVDYMGNGCEAYEAFPNFCDTKLFNNDDFNAQEMCCVCQHRDITQNVTRGGEYVGARIMGGGGQQRRRLLAEAGISTHMQEHQLHKGRLHAHVRRQLRDTKHRATRRGGSRRPAYRPRKKATMHTRRRLQREDSSKPTTKEAAKAMQVKHMNKQKALKAEMEAKVQQFVMKAKKQVEMMKK
jgi:hypothetical protein